MSDADQPRAEWVFIEQKKSNKGRIWLIIGLSVVAIAIVGAVVFFLVPRDAAPTPGVSTSPSPSATSTGSASPAPSPSTEPESPITPSASPPPAPEVSLEDFTTLVKPRLDDGVRGLDLVTDNMDVGAQIVDSLQQDAGALADQAAPSSILGEWRAAVSEYANALDDLRTALDDGAEAKAPLDTSRAALDKLRGVVGL